MAEINANLEAVPEQERRRGHIAMLFANMVWGLMSPVSKEVLMLGCITPLGLSAIRVWGGALLFCLSSFLLPQSVVVREKVERRDLWKIFLASLLIITSNQALFIVGISYTNPIDSSVVATLTPIFTMIFAAIIIGERITPLKAIGVEIGLTGALMLVAMSVDGAGGEAPNPILGNSLCLIAQISAAIYYVAFKDIINKYSPFTLMKMMFLMSSITLIPFTAGSMAETQWSEIPAFAFADIVFIVVFATFIGYLLIPYTQRRLKPTLVSMYNYLQPVTSAFYSIALGIAALTASKLIATALIFLGVWVVTQSRNSGRWSDLLRKCGKRGVAMIVAMMIGGVPYLAAHDAGIDSIESRLDRGERFQADLQKVAKYLPKLSGYVSAGYNYMEDSKSEFYVKCARIDINGTLGERFDYRVLFDFYKVKAYDVRMRFKPMKELNFSVGYFKVPFSLGNMRGPLTEEFITFPVVIQRLVGWSDVCGMSGGSGRDIGVSAYGTLWRLKGRNVIDYAAGVFNGNGSNAADDNSSKDFSGSITIRPIKGREIAGSYYWGEYGTEYLSRKRWCVGGAYSNRLLLLRGEYVAGTTGCVRSDGYYVFGGIKTRCGITPLVRYEAFRADKSAGMTERIYTAGIDWHLLKHLRIQGNYARYVYSAGMPQSDKNQLQILITGII